MNVLCVSKGFEIKNPSEDITGFKVDEPRGSLVIYEE